MLGDNPEKSKNTLKKTVFRRNAKTVQFSSPTYHEAAVMEYSTDDEDPDEDPDALDDGVEPESAEMDRDETVNADEITVVEPLRLRSQPTDGDPDIIEPGRPYVDRKEADDQAVTGEMTSQDAPTDRQGKLYTLPPVGQDSLLRLLMALFTWVAEAIIKSRNGIVRNTDSFFKDDNGETRKITLTPNLLRDDSSGQGRNVDAREVRRVLLDHLVFADEWLFLSHQLKAKGSLELLEKTHVPAERSKEDAKKKKEKKSGMLSGLFRRKDKKNRTADDEADDLMSTDKRSGESLRDAGLPKDSEESSRSELQNAPLGAPSVQQGQAAGAPTSQTPNKLQKKPSKTDTSMSPNPPITAMSTIRGKPPSQPPAPDRPAPSVGPSASTVRAVNVGTEGENLLRPSYMASIPSVDENQKWEQPHLVQTPDARGDGSRQEASAFGQSRLETVRRVEKRMELDDVDSSADEEKVGGVKDGVRSQPAGGDVARLSESPVQIPSPTTATTTDGSRVRSPGPVIRSASQDESSSSSSPEMVDAPEIPERGRRSGSQDGDGRTSTPSLSTSTSTTNRTPTWSDAQLRTYLENDDEIRDLLIVVHDRSGVVPAGDDHPIVGGLFKEETARIGEITQVCLSL